MNRSVATLLISAGLLLPAMLHADPPAGAARTGIALASVGNVPPSGTVGPGSVTQAERDILEGLTDEDILNLKRVHPDLFREIIRNWPRKTPEQKAELQAALRDFATQPDPREWEAANRPPLQPRVVGATGGGVMGGVIGGAVIASTHLLALQAIRAGQPLTRWMGLFFRPVATMAGKLAGIAPRWGMIGAGVALTAAAGAAAWYGISSWMQKRQQGRDRSAYLAERTRLSTRLTMLARAQAPVPEVTPAPVAPGAPGIAPAVPAPIIDPDDLRITNRQDGP